MNHPSREVWMSFLYGELTADETANLQAHLRVCPECTVAVDRWRGTMRALDQWSLPANRQASSRRASVLKWGMAALLVLGLGFGLGRVSTRAQVSAMRGELESAVKSSLEPQLRQEMAADRRNLMEGVVNALKAARNEDRQALLTLYQRFERQRVADYASLRKDLETVAIVAEGRLYQAQAQIGQLAAYTQSGNPDNSTSAGLLPVNNSTRKGN